MDFIRKDMPRRMRVREADPGDGTVLPLLEFPSLAELDYIRHGFTTRAGGVSRGIYATLNLSFTRGDREENVRENFRRAAQALGVEYDRMVCTHQTHSVQVRAVTGRDAGKGLTCAGYAGDADGLVTDTPGITLTAFFADCVPLYFADPPHRAIGLAHSGWRGTVGRIGRETLRVMREQFGTRPEDVICAVGPSICRDCYEVGSEVAEEFEKEFPARAGEILREKGNGKYLLDLWRANEIVLLEAGVRGGHISVTDICTCCNPELLFSHRASHGRRGNLGAFLGLVPGT